MGELVILFAGAACLVVAVFWACGCILALTAGAIWLVAQGLSAIWGWINGYVR